MHKVISFELKKIVSRPGIYLLALILACLLTVTAFVYKPTSPSREYLQLNGTSVTEMASDFANYKEQYDAQIESWLKVAEEIEDNNFKFYEEEINSLYIETKDNINTFIENSTNITVTNQYAFLYDIHNADKNGSLDRLYAKLIEFIGEEKDSYHPVTTTKSNYSKMINDITFINDDIESTIASKSYSIIANAFANDYLDRITNIVQEIVYPNYSRVIDLFLKNGNYYNVTVERLRILYLEMEDIVAQANANSGANNFSKSLMDEYTDLFNQYRMVSSIYTNLLTYNLNMVVLDNYSASERTQIKYYDDIDYYNNQENLTKYTYYITNDTNEYSYANPLSFDYSSNQKTNAYDYSYFALSIFGVILIAFAITFASHAIAGESKEGTMRFVSIRPISRTSLILGKFFAIAIITLIMLIFSAVASMVVGGFLFGMSSLDILSVVNATKVVTIHPMLSLAIFVASTYLKILVFVSIAMLFTSFLKSDLLTLILTLLIYVVHLMLPLFFGVNSWLRFNPLANIDLFAYLGSGTMTAKTILGQMFTSVVYNGINIWISLIFISAMIIGFNLISIFAFKKREL